MVIVLSQIIWQSKVNVNVTGLVTQWDQSNERTKQRVLQSSVQSSINSHMNYTISNHFTVLLTHTPYSLYNWFACIIWLWFFSPSPALFSLKYSISASQLVNKCILPLHPFSTLGQECIFLVSSTRIHTSKPRLSTPSAISLQDLSQSSKSHLKV